MDRCRAVPALSVLAVAMSLACSGLIACVGPVGPTAPGARASVRSAAADTAAAQVGAPYRSGGASPEGFDCSGLVVYSFSRAGLRGLPHSAARLETLARPVSLDELLPGDLLFFQLSWRKTSHVGIYLGDRTFVHAPSSGKRVERATFDHVYWSTKLGRAGRL